MQNTIHKFLANPAIKRFAHISLARCLFILIAAILFFVNSAVANNFIDTESHYEVSDLTSPFPYAWVFPNEEFPNRAKKLLEKTIPGIYLSVGTE